MDPPGAILALDAGSPLVSVAVGSGGRVAAERAVEIGRSSERLLAMIDEVLREAAVGGIAALAGIVALAGPGSFTGLRVGLATALGLAQASGVPAAALPPPRVLAAAAPGAPGAPDEEARWAVVDVLRDEWAAQEYAPAAAGLPPRAVGEVERLATSELLDRLSRRPASVVGFTVSRLAERFEAGPPPGLRLVEPPPLAATTVRLAGVDPPEWDAGSLTRPIYFRPPATTSPRPRPRR